MVERRLQMRKTILVFTVATVLFASVWWLRLSKAVATRHRVQCKANLSQLAFQLSDAFPDGWFPRDVIDQESGVALLSWRVRVIKNLAPDLYAQFDLTKAWDSPENAPLIKKMPGLFRCPDSDELLRAGLSDYVALKVSGTGHCAYQSQVILIVEHQSNIPWTKPMDIQFGSEIAVREFFTNAPSFHTYGLLQDAVIQRLENPEDLTIVKVP